MKTTRYPFSVIREAMARRGDDVLDFAIGSALPAPPPAIVEMVRRDATLALQRAGRDDLAKLTHAAAAMLAREFGVTVDPATILPAPGGRAAISAVAAALIAPDDAVLVTEPSYPAFARVARQHHARVLEARLDPARGFAPDLAALGGEIESIRLAGLNYPNNPTATLLDAATLAELPADAMLFNDAAYGPLVYDGPPRSLLAVTDRPVLEMHALSKLYGTGALPVCFLAGNTALIDGLRTYGDFAWTPPSTLQTRVATACLEDAEHLATLRARCGAKVAALRELLSGLGYEPFSTPAGFYVLCPLTEGSPWDVTLEMIERRGVAVMPYEHGGDRYLRFSTLHREGELEQLAGRLA